MNLASYYIELNKCLGEDFSEYEFDERGIPLTRFHRKKNWRHNPITVSQYALFHFNQDKEQKKSHSKDIFLEQANWLIQNAEQGPKNTAVWYYLFDLPYYGLKSPWISGMAQGQALSVLLRAYQLTKDSTFLKTAESVLPIFEIDVNNNGVQGHFPDGLPVIEEYPSLNVSSCVLNGFIFGIFGLYDYAIFTESDLAKKLFNKYLHSLEANLFRYDSGYWSYYELKQPLRLASKSYHRIHIEQLKALRKITEKELFKNYSDRWIAYQHSFKSKFMWLIKKIIQKVIHRI